ncbi:MAG: nucleic acid binding OB-fold tRNA/helicase-type [Candidatus Parvarchaeum acidiphilum ARMAN-4]|jgi:ssDNA-binding replication factor A large subunit|uniref:Nucleic acid binding OB-fold tRNA/helicase-type n=1 Tax=Candidatus Parvarchaeum acidiphilum ARMAN-4 TaxID=662760 RepID=D2EFX0_PARA4|nr:MAG: nucleic acid binding OB-fold tRNA/helicase-type [Candidatus Parvarchaeum acidiphilum ARMAN-4]
MEEWIIDKITEKNNKSKEEIINIINQRKAQLPDLTEDAILRMLATENGIIPIKRDYKIEEIKQKINHVNISAKIKRKFPPRTVTVKGREARVMNFVIEDQSGEIPVVTWDENYIDKIMKSRDGESISIANAYAKENPFNGIIELNLGNGSAISISQTESPKKEIEKIEYKKIAEIRDGEYANISGFITRLFSDDIYLIRCSICKKKVDVECEIHKDKALSKTLRIRGILDDGLYSSSITFFDKQAEELLELSQNQEIKSKLNDISFGLYQVNVNAKMNKFNDNYSLTARKVASINYTL